MSTKLVTIYYYRHTLQYYLCSIQGGGGGSFAVTFLKHTVNKLLFEKLNQGAFQLELWFLITYYCGYCCLGIVLN